MQLRKIGLAALGLADLEKTGGLALLVYKRRHFDACFLDDLREAKNVLWINWKRLMADHVEIWASGYFFGGDAAEFSVVQTHSNFVVYISPLRNQVDLMTILSVSLHKVWSLVEVFEDKVFGQLAIRTRLPTTKLGKSLIRGQSFARSEGLQVLCKHLLIIYN